MKVSPAQLIYGNSIDLDANILLPRDEIDLDFHSLSKSTDTMLTLQDELIQITARLLKESDDIHNAQQSPNITQFGVDKCARATANNTRNTHEHTMAWSNASCQSQLRRVYITRSNNTQRKSVPHDSTKTFSIRPNSCRPNRDSS